MHLYSIRTLYGRNLHLTLVALQSIATPTGAVCEASPNDAPTRVCAGGAPSPGGGTAPTVTPGAALAAASGSSSSISNTHIILIGTTLGVFMLLLLVVVALVWYRWRFQTQVLQLQSSSQHVLAWEAEGPSQKQQYDSAIDRGGAFEHHGGGMQESVVAGAAPGALTSVGSTAVTTMARALVTTYQPAAAAMTAEPVRTHLPGRMSVPLQAEPQRTNPEPGSLPFSLPPLRLPPWVVAAEPGSSLPSIHPPTPRTGINISAVTSTSPACPPSLPPGPGRLVSLRTVASTHQPGPPATAPLVPLTRTPETTPQVDLPGEIVAAEMSGHSQQLLAANLGPLLGREQQQQIQVRQEASINRGAEVSTA